MCINKKHKKQNLPITPETEKEGSKVVLLYFFVLGRQSGWIKEGDRHFCYSFCSVCSASNQSIKINFCAQSDRHSLKNHNPQPPSPIPHPRLSTGHPRIPAIADIKVWLANLCAPFVLFVYSVLYYRWLHFGSLCLCCFASALVVYLGPNLSTARKGCRAGTRQGE